VKALNASNDTVPSAACASSRTTLFRPLRDVISWIRRSPVQHIVQHGFKRARQISTHIFMYNDTKLFSSRHVTMSHVIK